MPIVKDKQQKLGESFWNTSSLISIQYHSCWSYVENEKKKKNRKEKSKTKFTWNKSFRSDEANHQD